MRKPFDNLKGWPSATTHLRRWSFIVIFSLAAVLSLQAEDTNLANEVQLLREQNALLQQQVKQQGEQINSLTQQFHDLQAAPPIEGGNDRPLPESRFSLDQVHIGGEGGVGYAQTGPDGFAPDGKFRVDDARVFLESPLWGDVYFYGEVVLATQESPNMNAQLGEIYVEFESLSKLWKQDNQLNARLGQMYIPFGEEYLVRNAIDDPLITHSIVDFWGVTPGVELYGGLGKFSYVVAAQNGAQDDTGAGGDKSVAGRIGYDPDEHWHFSVSGMRTGNLNADQISATWFGNGFFRSIGSPSTTQFHVDAAEADATARWKSGQVSAFGGWARYHDDDPGADNTRNIYYYSVEARQTLLKKFYAVTRWSQAFCHDGIPMVGYGDFSGFLYGPLTTDLWRLSLGFGYRFSDQLVLKAEYSFERGEELGGGARSHEDFFGTEAAFKF
jgi:hypothetical protein